MVGTIKRLSHAWSYERAGKDRYVVRYIELDCRSCFAMLNSPQTAQG